MIRVAVGSIRARWRNELRRLPQVDHSLHRTQGGLGIGLSIAKRLVEMHGGRLEARSAGLGRGCEFIVHLPLHISPPAEDSSRRTDLESPSEGSLRVLVADDNMDAAASLALVLEMKGHHVRTVHDGVEAVQAAASFQPDIVILDIGMPRLDGYEACRQIRAQPGSGDMLIIALSGWGQVEDKQRSKEAGFNHHLVKPADVGAIEELLRARATRARK